MAYYYSTNRNVQLLVALLKAHGIRKVVASPGTTNMELVGSLQHDGAFQMYSCVDERSAAYLACGLSAESGEPVVITCTEATASRNYLPGLTEAYHRKLPILAVTGLHSYRDIGQLSPQVIDRSVSPADAVRLKVRLNPVSSPEDERESVLQITRAILELKRHGGGPVHIDLPWGGPKMEYSAQRLPQVPLIRRYFPGDSLPEIHLEEGQKLLVLAGGHHEWTKAQTEALDRFCEAYDAAVLCDHASRYYGRFRVQATILAAQDVSYDVLRDIGLLIHIGEEGTDDRLMQKLSTFVRTVWRVSPDGELRDPLHRLNAVFEMDEQAFFTRYSEGKEPRPSALLEAFRETLGEVRAKLPELPFSSLYTASRLSALLPAGARVHLGCSDTIRAWNYFPLPEGVRSACNSGCRGIDGTVSSLIGASLASPERLFFGVMGDLTFFYDMTVLGNRHVGPNLRLMIVHNDGGNIFRHHGHPSQRWLGREEADEYICAGGHFGGQSPSFVRDFAENLGFRFLTASDQESFEKCLPDFVSPEPSVRPVLFEVFTDAEQDAEAFERMEKIDQTGKSQAKEALRSVLGEQGAEKLKRLFKK